MSAKVCIQSKHQMVILVCLLVGSASGLFAQRDITGRSWTRWNDENKVIYLMGFYAGMKADVSLFAQAERDYPLRSPVERNPASVDRYKAERMEYYSRKVKYDFKVIRELIDIFYTDPDNLMIPVPAAIRIIMLREDGEHERSNFLLLDGRRKTLEGK